MTDKCKGCGAGKGCPRFEKCSCCAKCRNCGESHGATFVPVTPQPSAPFADPYRWEMPEPFIVQPNWVVGDAAGYYPKCWEGSTIGPLTVTSPTITFNGSGVS